MEAGGGKGVDRAGKFPFSLKVEFRSKSNI